MVENRRISYSFLNTMNCSYQNFLRYDAGIKPVTSRWIALGNSFHYSLETVHKNGEWSLKDAIDLFRFEFNRIITDEEVFISYPEIKKFEAEGIDMLNIYDNVLSAGSLPLNPTDNEIEFKLMIDSQEVVGRIDRLDGGQGNYVVTDYKTGTKKPDPWFLSKNFQFTAYALGVRELFGELPVKLQWYHARTGSIIETTRTQEDIDDLIIAIRNTVKMRELKIRHRIYNEAVCQWCDYSEGWGNKSGICSDRELEKRLIREVEFKYNDQK